MTNNKINIGVVGAGKLGTYHIQKLQMILNCDLRGVYDLDKQSMIRCESDYNVKTFDNIDSLLDVCDAVTIATPTIAHYNVAKRALDRGLHVFIEKPITDNIQDAIKLSSIAKSSNKLIQVGHIERFNNAFKESLKFIDNPQFIEIHRIFSSDYSRAEALLHNHFQEKRLYGEAGIEWFLLDPEDVEWLKSITVFEDIEDEIS